MAIWAPAPAPVATASGSVPKMKASDVIRIGRKRSRAAMTAASASVLPFSNRAFVNSTIRMAFLIASPTVVSKTDLEVDVVVETTHQRAGSRS
jgi:hypothetical protein